MEILNAFAGIGGNRLHWDRLGHFNITAIESDPQIAEEYKKNFPRDAVIVADAYSWIQFHVEKYDIIWASPPCQSHSKLTLCTGKRQLPDLRLYSLVIFLQKYHNGKWIVENVQPHYQELIRAQKIGRHLFWSNVTFSNGVKIPKVPKSHWFASELGVEDQIQQWQKYHGIKLSKRFYIRNNHDPCQIYRNAVHPLLGFQLLKQMIQNKAGLEKFMS